MKLIFLVLLLAVASCSATEGDAKSEDGKSPEQYAYDQAEILNIAIRHGNVSEVRSLFAKGIHFKPVKAPGYEPPEYSVPPLHFVIDQMLFLRNNGKRVAHMEIFNLLVNNSPDLEIVDKFPKTALYTAVQNENPEAVKILLEHGANANTYYENDMFHFNTTVLQQAFYSSHGKEEIIQLLIEHGANVNQAGRDGGTPLHQAIIGGHKRTIELLLEKGAHINAVENNWQMTPLHFLVVLADWNEDDKLRYAKLLIDHGADLHAVAHYRGQDGTPLDLATSSKLRKCLGSKMGFTGGLRTIF